MGLMMRGPLNRGHLEAPMSNTLLGQAERPWNKKTPRTGFEAGCVEVEARDAPQPIDLRYGKRDSIHRHLLEAVSETANVLELRQKLLYTTPSGWWWWWCIESVLRRYLVADKWSQQYWGRCKSHEF